MKNKLWDARDLEHPQYLNDVLVFLLAAVLVVSTFRRIHVSPIIGYLIAGLLMGPYAMGFIAEVKGVNSLGELGVVFLLFSIGLKLSLPRLQMMKRYVFGLGSLQVLSCGAALGFIAYYFGQTVEAAVLIGSALALSSTAVGIQIMTEREELATRYGRVSFSVLLFQDLMVVILLVLLTTIGQKDVHILAELGRAAWKAGVVLAIIIAVGWLVLRPVYRAIANLNSPELFVAMTLLVVLTTSVTT
ncbi:MAG: cation:proton antiporter, partial [Alphaproteobacteria bacterium]